LSTEAIRQTTCPDAATLQRLLTDGLPAAEQAPLQQHIDACPTCQQVLERLIGTLPGAVDAIAPGQSTQPRTEVVAPSTGPPSGPPAQVPGYDVLGEVGRGGMGVVYKARQLGLGRVVALKMILAGGHAGAQELARFQAEAEVVARLQHPNIIQIFEVGQTDGRPFLALEFCGGGSLAGKVNGTPLQPLAAAELAQTLARAVHAAHEAKVIHRDLKPANVLLTADGTPKITDFGLAKKLDEAGQTQSGMVMGTPSYMAPEQAGGKTGNLGPPTDVYALGAILYEFLTGRPPFKAASTLETIQQVVADEPVPPSSLQPKTQRDLETICLKCLQKQPARRYASALELAEDLRRFQAGEPIHARPVGRSERLAKWCRRHPGVAALSAALALLLLVAGGLVTWQWQEAEAALAGLRSEKAARARRQVDALPDAAPGRVSAILDELQANRADVLLQLRQRYEEENEPHRRMRLALALVPVEPETFRTPLTGWMLRAEDPAEVVLVRDVLAPHGKEMAARLWAHVGEAREPAGVCVRALAALAAYDPDNGRWQELGPQVAQHLLEANPLHRALWAEALRPVGQTLLAPPDQADYFPLKVGTKWHYRREDASTGATERQVQQVAEVEKIDGRAVLARLEVVSQGTVTLTEHVSRTAVGICRHRTDRIDITPPQRLLRFPVKAPDAWASEIKIGDLEGKLTCRVIGRETLTVPAGKFDTVRVDMEMAWVGAEKWQVTTWFAPGTGVVKDTATQWLSPAWLAASVTTIGLMGSPSGGGPLHAATFLYPRTLTYTRVLEKLEPGK
jgi:hypothetical protein